MSVFLKRIERNRLEDYKAVPLLEASDLVYFNTYLAKLEIFLYKESVSLTTLEYYKIMKEIETVKEYIKKIK